MLAEPNDNFRYARRLVGQQLLAILIADLAGKTSAIAINQGASQKAGVLQPAGNDGCRTGTGE